MVRPLESLKEIMYSDCFNLYGFWYVIAWHVSSNVIFVSFLSICVTDFTTPH